MRFFREHNGREKSKEKLGEEKIRLPRQGTGWKVVDNLGQGSYGKVCKARQTLMWKELYCVVKVIDSPYDDRELQETFREYGDEASVRSYYKEVADDYLKEMKVLSIRKLKIL